MLASDRGPGTRDRALCQGSTEEPVGDFGGGDFRQRRLPALSRMAALLPLTAGS